MRLQRFAGFTLIEVLVVLVIASLVTSILFSAMSQMLNVQRRLSETVSAQTDAAMRENWFRLLIQGLYPDERRGPAEFKGEARTLSGLTLFPLNAPVGGAAVFTLSIEPRRGSDDMVLHYKSDQTDLTVLSWPGRTGRFWYEDGAGQRYEQWPPLIGDPDQLPKVVLLQMQVDEQPRLIPAVPVGPLSPPRSSADVLKTTD